MLTAYIISGLFLALGLVFVIFKPARLLVLLAGYNTMSAEKKAKWNEKSLCVFAGWLLIATAAFMLGRELLAKYTTISETVLGAWIAIYIALLLASILYVNVSKRFKR